MGRHKKEKGEEKKEEENKEENNAENNGEVEENKELGEGEGDNDLKKPSKISKEEQKDDISSAATKKEKKEKKPKKPKKDKSDNTESQVTEKEEKKKTKKAKKGDDNDSPDKAKILAYMREQNRPYSILNIFDNLHGEIKKAELQKHLDSLVAEGELQSKDFGKFVVYLAHQDKMPTVPQEELNKMDAEIDSLREKMKDLSEQYKEKQKSIFFGR